jgi:hypothetical protein
MALFFLLRNKHDLPRIIDAFIIISLFFLVIFIVVISFLDENHIVLMVLFLSVFCLLMSSLLFVFLSMNLSSDSKINSTIVYIIFFSSSLIFLLLSYSLSHDMCDPRKNFTKEFLFIVFSVTMLVFFASGYRLAKIALTDSSDLGKNQFYSLTLDQDGVGMFNAFTNCNLKPELKYTVLRYGFKILNDKGASIYIEVNTKEGNTFNFPISKTHAELGIFKLKSIFKDSNRKLSCSNLS